MEKPQSALSDLEQRFRDSMQGAPVGITIFRGENFIVEMASDKYLQIVDRKHDEFVGRSLFDSLPEVRRDVEPLLRSVMASGSPYYGNEFPIMLNRYGHLEKSYFNFVYQPVKEKDGVVTGIVVIANEVTEFIHARERILQREAHFRNLVMTSPVAMTIFKGFDHIIEMANLIMFEKIWHKKEADVIGKKALDVFPELKSQKYPELLYRVMTTGVAHTEKEAMAMVQGDDILRKLYLDFTYAPLLDANHTPYGVVITVIDVTEKVQVREALARAEKTARLAIQSAELGTYEYDLHGDDFIASERFKQIWGIRNNPRRNELVNNIHPDDLEVRAKALEKGMQTGSFVYESRIIWPDHSEHWVNLRGTVLYDKENNPERIIGVVQDIDDQKEYSSRLQRQVQERTEELQTVNEEIAATNEELSESNQLLVEANRDLEQFNYAASHDLQEPLRKIQTFTNILLEGDKLKMGDTDKDYLVKISSSVTRMKAIIDDLLSYSHNTMKDQDQLNVDLNKVIMEVTEDLEVVIDSKVAQIDRAYLPTIIAIPTQMHQLFLNLLSNALKFSKADTQPVITITTAPIAASEFIRYPNLDQRLEYFEISVSDNGIGFPEKYSDYVFGLFKRLHNKTTYSGTGIGLTLCRKIARNHNGEIFASSQEGLGTTITIALPISRLVRS